MSSKFLKVESLKTSLYHRVIKYEREYVTTGKISGFNEIKYVIC